MIATKKNGTLYMVANNIGDILDTPNRSLEILRDSHFVIFEEAKGARKALKQAGVQKKFALFNEHYQEDVLKLAKEYLKKGKNVCYMSDQGSPTLCDPGAALSALAFQINAPIKVIPGPSSVTAAMSACPSPINDFIFTGLLPRKDSDRERKLKSYVKIKTTLIILDTPYRRKQVIETLMTLVGSNRKALLALEISGKEEAYHYGSLKTIQEKTKDLEKLNFILILSP